MAEVAQNIATAALSVVALALFLIAIRAWHKTSSSKVLLLGLAFAAFLVKGIFLTAALFRRDQWSVDLILPLVLLDLVALGLVYAAVLAPLRS